MGQSGRGFRCYGGGGGWDGCGKVELLRLGVDRGSDSVVEVRCRWQGSRMDVIVGMG